MNDLVINFINFVIAPVVTVIVTTWVNKKKHASEAKQSELQNVEQAIKIWRELAESFEQKFTEKQEELKDVQSKLDQLIKQNLQILKDMDALKKDYDKLQRSYDSLKQNSK